MTMSFLRLHENVPFCYTRVHLPLQTRPQPPGAS